MAEFLVVISGTDHPSDFYKNCALPKRGDVIDVKEDGAIWGKKELSDPRWRVFRIPGMPIEEARQWTAREQAQSPVKGKTLQYRAFKFDIDAAILADVDFAAFVDGKDANVVYEVKAPLAIIRAAKVARPKIQDPAVIGDDPFIIG
jgi:hypothetical protein